MDGALDFDAYIRDTNFSRQLNAMEQRIIGFSRRVDTETRSVDDTFTRLGQTAAGVFAFAQISQLPGQIVRVRGEFQQLGIALETILGNKSESDKLFAETVALAAKTPFSLREAGQGAKQLLAYGIAADQVNETLRRLGDIASGLSVPLNDLTYLYGTTRTQGRLFTQDLNQFVGRGIPLIAGLAKEFNVAESEVKGLVEAGKVGFPEVEKVINNLTNEGGMFFNLMEKQSKSLTGLMSNLGDAIDKALNDIGEQNEGALTAVLTGAISVAENYEKIVDVLAVVIATYGAYKAATLTVVVANRLIAASSTATLFLEMARGLGTVTAATYVQATAIGVQTRAQAALNAVMSANPYILAATAIIALAGTVYLLNDSTTAAEEAQQRLTEAHERDEKAKADLTSKTRELTSVIQSETSTEFAKIQAYEKLQKLYPGLLTNMTLQQFASLGAADAQRQLNAAMDAMQIKNTSDQFKEATGKVQEYEKKLRTLTAQQQSSGAGGAGLVIPIEETRKALEASRIEAEKLGDQVKNNEKVAWDANTPVEQKIVHYQQLKDSLEEQRKSIESSIANAQRLGGVAQGIKPFFDQLTLDGLNKQIDEVSGKLGGLMGGSATGPADGGNKAFWEGQKNKAQDALDSLGTGKRGSAEWNRLTADIRKADEQLKKYSTTVKTSSAKVPEKDKPQPFGSIAYWEQIARKAQEVIDKTPATDVAGIQRQNAIRLEAERKADEIRKITSVRTFDQEIEEKRKRYELYQKWVTNLGQSAADKEFSDLIKGGSSFAEFLQNQIAQLRNLETGPGLLTGEANRLVQLNETLNAFTGQTTPLEAFQRGIDNVRESGQSFSEVLEELLTLQKELDANPNQGDYYEKRKAVAEEILNVEKERKGQLDDFLKEVDASEQQRVFIQKKYADLRAELDKRGLSKNSESYRKAIQAINDAESDELTEANRRLLEKSQAYRDLTAVIEQTGQKALKIRIDLLNKALLETEKALGKESEEYKRLLAERKGAEDQLAAGTIAIARKFAALGGELGQALGQANGALGQTGQLLSGIAGQMDNVITAFDKSADSSDKISAGVSGLINLIGIAINSARQRKQAEQDYYQSVISFQQEYNLLLNEQIGLRSEASENVFVTDYISRLKDGVDQFADAQSKYNESLAKLTGGKAKSGQKNGVDFGAVGQGAGSGAAIGAAVGTIVLVPIIGTAIGAGVGAIVGGLVGLFAGKKKKDTFVGILEAYPNLIRTAADGTQSLNEELAQALISGDQLDDATKQLVQNTLDWQKAMEEAKKAITQVVSELAGSLGNDLRNSLVNAFKEGEDAAKAFGDSVAAVIENIVTQLLFNQLFAKDFEALQKRMEASYGVNGDQNFVDDLVDFYKEAGPKAKEFSEGLQSAKDQLAKEGIELFKPSGSAGAETSPNSLSGAIRGMSEETAGILAGQFNAIRINGAETVQLTRQSLLHLSNISRNTAYLITIDRTLKDMQSSDPLRAGGLPK